MEVSGDGERQANVAAQEMLHSNIAKNVDELPERPQTHARQDPAPTMGAIAFSAGSMARVQGQRPRR